MKLRAWKETISVQVTEAVTNEGLPSANHLHKLYACTYTVSVIMAKHD